MDTAVQWAKCWLFLSVQMINTERNVAENCTAVEFDGLGPGENSREIEESNYINLTFRQNDQKALQIKISHQQNNLTVDLCKFILKPACEVSDSSNATSHCQCLNNHTVQFIKKASISDSGLYTWKWRLGKTPEKQRDIFINVRKVIPPNETASAATTATIVCVLLTVVVTSTVVAVFWMRNKAKCSIDVKDCGRYFRWRVADHAVDNQVNCQTFNTLDNPHFAVVKEPAANHNYDPNYADVNDAIQHDDPNYSDIKEQDKSQPLQSSYYENNMEKRSDDSPYAYVKRKGTSQLTDPTNPSVNSQDASQPLDPYYSDIKEPTTSHNYDPNHTNDKEHKESHNYDPNYADINEHLATQPLDPYPGFKQHSSHNYDPKYPEFMVEENSKPDDPDYAHVKKQMMRHLDNSTDACVKAEDTIQPDDLVYVKKQDASLAVDTTYPRINKQETELEGDFAYGPKNKQDPAQPHHPTYVQGKEDTSDRGSLVYNHLHDIRQHDDPNYDHIESNTRQLADLPFQQVIGNNGLSCPNVNKENTSQKDGLLYDHIKQQDMSQPATLSFFYVNKEEDTIQPDDNYDHLIICSGVLVKVGSAP